MLKAHQIPPTGELRNRVAEAPQFFCAHSRQCAQGSYDRPMESRILATGATSVPVTPLTEAAAAKTPAAGLIEFAGTPVTCGLWEHTVGTSTDTEVDEVFVVLTGRARILIEGGPELDVGPGDVVQLAAGAQTTWHVSEPLRKFWVTR